MTTDTDALQNLLDKYEIAPTPCLSDLPEGWVGIVDELISDLIELGWDRDLQQVKEKFGGLRFSIGANDYNDEVWEAMSFRIRQAEAESIKTCEVCGEAGERVCIRDWWSTLCTEHQKVRANGH